MDISANTKNIRISPRKVRLVRGVIMGLDALRARAVLQYTIKRSAHPMMKILDSALANARNNFGLVQSNMFVKDVIVNEGPKLKRYRPKGFGSSSPIQKKTSHIKIVLSERVPGMKADKQEKKMVQSAQDEKIEITAKNTKVKRDSKKDTDIETKKPTEGAKKRRLFQRKTI